MKAVTGSCFLTLPSAKTPNLYSPPIPTPSVYPQNPRSRPIQGPGRQAWKAHLDRVVTTVVTAGAVAGAPLGAAKSTPRAGLALRRCPAIRGKTKHRGVTVWRRLVTLVLRNPGDMVWPRGPKATSSW